MYSGTRRDIGSMRDIESPRGCRGVGRLLGVSGCIGGWQGV